VQDKERDNQRGDRDAVARDIEEILVGFNHQRNMPPHRLDDQRAKHDHEGHRQRCHGGKQGVADRFQPQHVPAPRLDHRIGAVEGNAQRFNAVRGKIHREHRADGQDVTPGRRQHVVDFPRKGIADLLRPDLEQQPRGLIGEFLRPEEAGERRQHDQKRKQRHQGRQRDVTGDRPAVIGKKRVERVHPDVKDVANLPHN